MNFSKLLEAAADTVSLVKNGIDSTHNFIDNTQDVAIEIKESIEEEEDGQDE